MTDLARWAAGQAGKALWDAGTRLRRAAMMASRYARSGEIADLVLRPGQVAHAWANGDVSAYWGRIRAKVVGDPAA